MLGVLNMIFLALSNLGAVSEWHACPPVSTCMPTHCQKSFPCVSTHRRLCFGPWLPGLASPPPASNSPPNFPPVHSDLLSIIDVAANERAVLYRERASGQYSAATCERLLYNCYRLLCWLQRRAVLPLSACPCATVALPGGCHSAL